jgi:hypothetical protein
MKRERERSPKTRRIGAYRCCVFDDDDNGDEECVLIT